MVETSDMHNETLIEQVREVMADTFGVDESDLPDNPSQTTFARWSSILHMVLIVSFEEHFGLTFSMEEMTSMTSLERIVDILNQRQALGLPA
jgi:acyl carrier protein